MENLASTLPMASSTSDNALHSDTQYDEADDSSEYGSSMSGAVFNFTNSIVGAGCIGLGGAIAVSGGLISILLVLFFAILTKLSLDLLIRLSIEQSSTTMTASYEDLAQSGMGYWKGRMLVMACKLSYSFGCLVAYIIVLKDNSAPALKSLIYGEGDDGNDYGGEETNWLYWLLSNDTKTSWLVSLFFILPLCLLRDMTPLAFGSLISVASMSTIVGIVIYIYFATDVRQEPAGGFYENWIEIRPGVLSNLGTFVFTFVSQHTVHLVFSSLKPSLRKIEKWKVVSSLALLAAGTVSLLIGVFVYITFWQNTKSDIFQIYPHGWMIDTAKLLLCVTMIFTFPLPFFTCRELIILIVIHPLCGIGQESDNGNESVAACVESPPDTEDDSTIDDLQRPLLADESRNEEIDVNGSDTPVDSNASHQSSPSTTPKNWLLPHDNRQLRLLGHVLITTLIWFAVTGLAIAAPNLGDVLDVVGCFSGGLIAFIIPGLLSFYIEGYNHLALLILTVGIVVGTVGTYYSLKQLIADL